MNLQHAGEIFVAKVDEGLLDLNAGIVDNYVNTIPSIHRGVDYCLCHLSVGN